MAYKITLDTDNDKHNKIQALKVVNDSGRSTTDLRFHFIKDNDKRVCIVTTYDEHETLPKEIQDVGINYKGLVQQTLS